MGNIGKATIIDPETSPKHEEYAQLLCELRKKKGMTIEEARKLTNDPLFFGCLMMKNGDADGQLAGARNTTGNVLRPALQIIKTAPGITCVSNTYLFAFAAIAWLAVIAIIRYTSSIEQPRDKSFTGQAIP